MLMTWEQVRWQEFVAVEHVFAVTEDRWQCSRVDDDDHIPEWNHRVRPSYASPAHANFHQAIAMSCLVVVSSQGACLEFRHRRHVANSRPSSQMMSRAYSSLMENANWCVSGILLFHRGTSLFRDEEMRSPELCLPSSPCSHSSVPVELHVLGSQHPVACVDVRLLSLLPLQEPVL